MNAVVGQTYSAPRAASLHLLPSNLDSKSTQVDTNMPEKQQNEICPVLQQLWASVIVFTLSQLVISFPQSLSTCPPPHTHIHRVENDRSSACPSVYCLPSILTCHLSLSPVCLYVSLSLTHTQTHTTVDLLCWFCPTGWSTSEDTIGGNLRPECSHCCL